MGVHNVKYREGPNSPRSLFGVIDDHKPLCTLAKLFFGQGDYACGACMGKRWGTWGRLLFTVSSDYPSTIKRAFAKAWNGRWRLSVRGIGCAQAGSDDLSALSLLFYIITLTLTNLVMCLQKDAMLLPHDSLANSSPVVKPVLHEN